MANKIANPSIFIKGKRTGLSTTLLLCLLLLASCGKKLAKLTPDERQTTDSIVGATYGIDSLARLQKRLESKGDRLGSIVALKMWGKMLRNESRFEEALNIHMRGLQQAEALNDTLEWVQALNNIGTDYRRMGIFDVAQEYHYQAWMISEACADTSFTAKKNRVISLNGLGNIYMTLGNYERADSVLRLALKGEKLLHSEVGQAINYANLGSIFEHRGQIDSAWAYYRLSMQYNQAAGGTLGISLGHTNFGLLYEKTQQYDKATEEYKTAYQLIKATKDEWHALNTLIALARIYHATGNKTNEMAYLGKAKTTAERIKSPEHLAEIHTLYYKHYKQRGDYRTALAAYEQATALQDSLLDMEKVNRIQNASLSIERNRQAREMDKARMKLEQERTARHTGYAIFTFVLVVLTVALATFLYIQRILRRSHQALKKLSDLRENFFTNITHEFRTPLTVILGLSHDLQSAAEDDTRKKAQTIERQGNGLLRLINQLLDISKIKSAVGNPDWHNGNITAYLAMIAESYRDYAAQRNIELEFSATGEIEMSFVPHYVSKVMNNLLSNAFKFTPANGKVTIAMWREDQRLRIDVADTGEGMGRETLCHIFEPFYQAETDTRGVGTGVGLALVKQIIDAVEGSITVESEVERGTTFRISLPIYNNSKLQTADTTAPNKPMLPELDETEPTNCEDGDDQCRLLIIEDNRDIATYIGSLLTDRYAVYYAADGKEGLEKAIDLVPDLIITDLMMPGIDGLEVCQQVRSNEIVNHIPIIVITAKITEEDRIKGIAAGADAYLSKPFNSDELRAQIETLLENRRLLQQKFAAMPVENKESKDETEEQNAEPHRQVDLLFLNKVADFIYMQLSQSKEVNVAIIASHMCMSPRQFYRKISALTGYAPLVYIQRLKIKKACNLLDKDPTISFAEVADQSGFEIYPNFVRAFKSVCGVTPTDYRKGNSA